MNDNINAGTYTVTTNSTWNDDYSYTIPNDYSYDNKIQEPNIIYTGMSNVVIDKSKYDMLEKITLELIADLYRCTLCESKEFLKKEIFEKETKNLLVEPKEWIDPELFKI